MSETQTVYEETQPFLCAQDDVYSQSQFEHSPDHQHTTSSQPNKRQKKSNAHQGLWKWFSSPATSDDMSPKINSEQKGLSFIPRNRDNEECEVEVVHVLPPPQLTPKTDNRSSNLMTPPRPASVSPHGSSAATLL